MAKFIFCAVLFSCCITTINTQDDKTLNLLKNSDQKERIRDIPDN